MLGFVNIVFFDFFRFVFYENINATFTVYFCWNIYATKSKLYAIIGHVLETELGILHGWGHKMYWWLECMSAKCRNSTRHFLMHLSSFVVKKNLTGWPLQSWSYPDKTKKNLNEDMQSCIPLQLHLEWQTYQLLGLLLTANMASYSP